MVAWTSNLFGPYQLAAYVKAKDNREIALFAEDLRSRRFITDLDPRICKILPGDEKEDAITLSSAAHCALLLINVDYRIRKEREIVQDLRKIGGVRLARAMWGPSDVMCIVEAKDAEAMRNLICDQIKILTGVAANTTLVCYPSA